MDNVFIVGDRYYPMPLFAKVVNEELDAYRSNTRSFIPNVCFDIDKSTQITEIAYKIRDLHYLE